MALLELSEGRKLPVWRTVRACYATVLQNLRQLVRISWLWLLMMVPVYTAVHWLYSNIWAAPVFQTMPLWVITSVTALPSVVELPFVASIAVAWHRLVLRHERVAGSAYLRLDKAIWRYALCSLGFLALTIGPLLCALDFALQRYAAPPDYDAAIPSLVIILPLMALALVAAIFLLPRLSLVLPALALGERLSPWDAWLATQGNALRLALASCLLHVARAIPGRPTAIAGPASVGADLGMDPHTGVDHRSERYQPTPGVHQLRRLQLDCLRPAHDLCGHAGVADVSVLHRPAR
jgi:hypothetical protein